MWFAEDSKNQWTRVCYIRYSSCFYIIHLRFALFVSRLTSQVEEQATSKLAVLQLTAELTKAREKVSTPSHCHFLLL